MPRPGNDAEALQAIDETLLVYREHPEDFVTEVLGADPWQKQFEICQAIAKPSARVAVPSCHGAGKTQSLAWLVWWFILCHPRSDSVKVIITAPSRTSATAILAASIKQCWLEIKRAFLDPSAQEMLGLGDEPTQNGWTAPWSPETKIIWFATREDDGADTGHASRAAGHHADHLLIIFEEASGIRKVIWDSIKGSLMGADRRFIAIGNPVDPSSSFARYCRREDVNTIRIDAYDFPNVVQKKQVLPYGPTVEAIEEIKKEYGEESGFFQWKVRGQFPTAGGEQSLIPDSMVSAARKRDPKETCTHPIDAIGIGCDTSRFGSDRTALMVMCRDCGGIIDAAAKTKDGLGDAPEMAIAGLILATARSWGLKGSDARQIAVDTTGGYGGGAVDYLREVEGWAVRGINFGDAADDEKKFANVRMELWWHLREWVRDVASLGDLEDGMFDHLRDELTAVRIVKYRPNGQMVLEAKEDIKERLGFSPDLADACCLAVRATPPPVRVSLRSDVPSRTDPYREKDQAESARDPLVGVQVGRIAKRGKLLPDW